MSRKIVYVSRVGFGACPSCGSHVKLDENPADTVCPYCSNRFGSPVATTTRSILAGAQSILSGRSGFLVASFIAASPLVSCGSSDKKTTDAPDTRFDTGSEPEPCSDYGGCSEMTDMTDATDAFDAFDGTFDGSDGTMDGSDSTMGASDGTIDGSDGTIDGTDGTIDGSDGTDGTVDGTDGTDGSDTTDVGFTTGSEPEPCADYGGCSEDAVDMTDASDG